MNLVDSCGWLEYLADGPNAGFFAVSLENQEKLLVRAPNGLYSVDRQAELS